MTDLEERILVLATDYLEWSWYETVPSHGNLDRHFAENLLHLLQGYEVRYSFREDGKAQTEYIPKYIPNKEGEEE